MFIIAMLFPVMLHAQKNSQWRGENRNGMYNETGLLKFWPAGGPQLLWKYEGLGESYASVAIANGKIYLTGQFDGNLILFVLDLKGQLLNKKEVGKEWNTNHTGSRCTITVNDGKLYINNSLGQMYCLDEATLKEVWTKNLLTDFDGKNLMWGMTESPLIVGDKIYATPGGVKHNMVALNKNTGALIWSSPGLGTTSAYCSPLYIGDQSVPMVVTATFKDIIAFHANTGKVIWSHPQVNFRNIHPNTPVYHNGMILSTTGYKGGTMLLRLKDGGKSVEQVWMNNDLDNQMGGVIKIGDYVYASGHENRYWYCIDWKTGKTMYNGGDIGECNVISADGMLYVYSAKGEMMLVKPDPDKFVMVSSFKVTLGDGPHWAHPVIHQGVLYIRHGNALMAYKIK